MWQRAADGVFIVALIHFSVTVRNLCVEAPCRISVETINRGGNCAGFKGGPSGWMPRPLSKGARKRDTDPRTGDADQFSGCAVRPDRVGGNGHQ
ncbi:hypothetical protein AZA_16638 [Nitrospirillum viridazoti Y2]|nr:hypothetical protein AZA_16638 [Nitrospirillum amazonense Y2]